MVANIIISKQTAEYMNKSKIKECLCEDKQTYFHIHKEDGLDTTYFFF